MAPKQHPWESTIKQVAALLSGVYLLLILIVVATLYFSLIY